MDRCGVAWFKMDESSGNLIDSKGSFVGTNNGTTVVAGVNGKARSFNTSNNYISFNGPIIPIGKKSIRFKFKINNVPNNPMIIMSNGGYEANIYGTTVYVRPSSFTFPGSIQFQVVEGTTIIGYASCEVNVCDGKWHDILFTANDDTINVYLDDMVNPINSRKFTKKETVQPSRNLFLGRYPRGDSPYIGLLDEVEIYGDRISLIPDKTLILHSGTYKYYSSSWLSIGSIATEQDYKRYGMDDISIIPESAWAELQGDVEIHYYTDDPNRTEASFTVETEPFTLAGEWGDKEIQVIEYTDNPTQNESIITFETEPFTFEDYFEGNSTLDILTYTDDETYTPTIKAEIGYSPIDELGDEFEIVAFSETEEKLDDVNVTLEALPYGQLVTRSEIISFYGEFKQFLTSISSTHTGLSKIRYLLSFDYGLTWKAFRHNIWRNVDVSEKVSIMTFGMRSSEINSIGKDDFYNHFTNGVTIGYYIEERAWMDENEQIHQTKVSSNASVDDIKISDLLFFVVNTIAAINANVSGNKILGQIIDEDLGNIQYRVKLNGEYIYPIGGTYTPLYNTPLDLDVPLDNDKIKIGVNNTVEVEFKDGWGHLESWSTSFIGKPIGLIFSTPSGQYYSNAFGEILRYLNFGTLIAGQTSLDEKVILSNTLPFKVKNIILTSDVDAQGIEIQFSKSNIPFTPQEGLIYENIVGTDESVEFYVRLKLHENAVGNHIFDINASADPTS